jgi:hypothetical protein
MVEFDARARGQVGRRAGPCDELREPGDVVGLHVCLEHGDDRRALVLGERDVLVYDVGVRVDDGELAVRLAAEEVGRARRLVVEELSEVHAWTLRGSGET